MIHGPRCWSPSRHQSGPDLPWPGPRSDWAIMAAELFPTKKLVPSASASSTSVQQYQQQNVTNNSSSSAQGCCNWQGLFPTIRERWAGPGPPLAHFKPAPPAPIYPQDVNCVGEIPNRDPDQFPISQNSNIYSWSQVSYKSVREFLHYLPVWDGSRFQICPSLSGEMKIRPAVFDFIDPDEGFSRLRVRWWWWM